MGEKKTEFDVIIAGGGPAGLSALLWCADLGLNAVLLEKENELGGQLLLTHNEIHNYLGIEAANGRELRDLFLRQMGNAKMNRITGMEIVKADLAQKIMTLSDGTEYSSRASIIATGVRRRKLNVPGEDEFNGRGVLISGKTSLNAIRGKTVVIAGGGDAALENAVILSEAASKVIVVHRRGTFTARNEFVKQSSKSESTEFCFDVQITKIIGKEFVEAVELRHLISGEISQLQADAILIRIGVEPNTEIFKNQIDLDGAGYIKIDANCSTSMDGIFAVGDAANSIAPTIATATGHGSIAAKAIFKKLNS